MIKNRGLLSIGMALLALLFSPPIHAAGFESEPQISTQPIGSFFYRHLANDMQLDLRELVKFEKKGFGHTEIIALIMISSATHESLKDLGNRRLKNKLTLETLSNEAKLDYGDLIKEARVIKAQIEAKGDQNLPPPLFEVATSTPTVTKAKKKKKDNKNEK